jgi:alpha-L-rhamnosidase
MKPVPDRRLGSLDASYPSAAGLIESHWRYEGDEWIWTFVIPKGSTASVTLPRESGAKEYSEGKHTVRVSL